LALVYLDVTKASRLDHQPGNFLGTQSFPDDSGLEVLIDTF
jgi:hypothetical protein